MIRLAFRAPAEQAELVLAALIELAPTGVELVDGEGFTEFAVYGAPGERPSFPEGPAAVGGAGAAGGRRREGLRARGAGQLGGEGELLPPPAPVTDDAQVAPVV